jgi:hypothetical protein
MTSPDMQLQSGLMRTRPIMILHSSMYLSARSTLGSRSSDCASPSNASKK